MKFIKYIIYIIKYVINNWKWYKASKPLSKGTSINPIFKRGQGIYPK